MNQLQRKTARRLGLGGGLLLAWLSYIGWVEYVGFSQGHSSTISDVLRLAWHTEPGAVLMVITLIIVIVEGLITHITWAGNATYKQLELDSKDDSER